MKKLDFTYPDELSNTSFKIKERTEKKLSIEDTSTLDTFLDDYPDSERIQSKSIQPFKIIKNYNYKPTIQRRKEMKQWLTSFLIGKGSKLLGTIAWIGAEKFNKESKLTPIYTKSWVPQKDSKNRTLIKGMEEEAGKKLIHYMSIIHDIYLFHKLIKTNSQAQKIEPHLDLQKNLYTKREFHGNTTVEIGGGVNSFRLKKRAEENARNIFLAYLANIFILEKESLISWSILDYSKDSLYALLHSKSFYLYEYNLSKDEYFLSIDDALRPSDPTKIFLWMKQKYFIKNEKNDTQFKNRSETRDEILNWCRRKVRHYSKTLQIGGHLISSTRLQMVFDYYWNTKHIPPLEQIIKGNKLYDSKLNNRFISGIKKKHTSLKTNYTIPYFLNMENDTILPFSYKGAMPYFIKRSNPKQDFYYGHFAGGCQARAWLLKYLMMIINIPTAVDYTLSDKNHAGIVMPEEPSPKSPQMWLLTHTDLLMRDMLKTCYTPISQYFFKWNEYVALLEKNGLSKYFVKKPTSSKILQGENAPQEIDRRLENNKHITLKIEEEKLKSIESNGEIISVIVSALIKLNRLGKGVDYLKGPYSNWVYAKNEIAQNKHLQIIENNMQKAIQLKGQGSRLLKSLYETYIKLLKESELSEKKSGDIAIFYLYDKVLLDIYSEW